ncbi:hypothetical protein [Kitasatospora sp. NPDC088783]|uniref:hypothetical protein n=1 Tax=Kitasatospora sp. NPDC088783 TaxID=3364077 RepID=UPI003825C12D
MARPHPDVAAQWADYGVNVGHAVYGDIHIHPIAAAVGPPGHRPDATGPAWAVRRAALGTAFRSFARACERAAAALSSIGRVPAGEEE